MTPTLGPTRSYLWMVTASQCGVLSDWGGTLVCAAQQLKCYYNPEDLCGEEWELNDEEIAALDLQGAASPMEVEGELPDMNAEEMAKKVFYLVKSVIRHRYHQAWRFLTLWEGSSSCRTYLGALFCLRAS